ncbi:LOW QUALITY PROTEIN: hypothetical protein QYF61_015657 [Mycteria americana]|uniref:Uncharacterized protein n=1 Tax=Mycteria americana TaxID=33587 RepID=A0AAN7MUH5_MYCAM|nr:LOW QUALITY PROTEIN: hypothetical protein QYF61_015657 [Mycteria americana]
MADKHTYQPITHLPPALFTALPLIFPLLASEDKILDDWSRKIDLYYIAEDDCIGDSYPSMCTAFGMIAPRSMAIRRESREVLQPSDHFRGPPLDPLQQLPVLLVLRAPELDAVLQLFVHQYPQVLFRRAALDHIIPQSVLKLRIVLTQDPALGLVEPHEVHTGPLLQLVQVPLDDIPSFWCVSCTTQLGVICKLAEGALDLSVNVTDENIEQRWSQYGPLRDTTCH